MFGESCELKLHVSKFETAAGELVWTCSKFDKALNFGSRKKSSLGENLTSGGEFGSDDWLSGISQNSGFLSTKFSK